MWLRSVLVGNIASADQTSTLIEGVCIARSASSGDIVPGTTQGIFYRGSRIVSGYVLTVNSQPVEALSSTVDEPFAGTYVGRADGPGGNESGAHPLVVIRRRYLGQGMREDITLVNYGDEAVYSEIELEIAADFADLDTVRLGHPGVESHAVLVGDDGRLALDAGRGSSRRGMRVSFHGATPTVDVGYAHFETLVPARGEWNVCVEVAPVISGEELVPRYRCGEAIERATPAARLEKWRRGIPRITTDHMLLAATIERSADDLGSLRIFDPERPEQVVVAAGVPWAMNLHGRDALFTGWMSLLVDPDIALGVLETLARFQGVDVDPLTEEEPGRILRKLQFGATSPLSLGGGAVSYSSVDSTPLFVMLLGELRRWGLAPEVVDRLLPHADRALSWIDEFGDRDGDGYVECQRASTRGLANQGWKDSPDAIRHADGSEVRGPVALCEVQAYVYAAFLARAHFAQESGESGLAAMYRKRAIDLRERFNNDFWLDKQGWLAGALDGDKEPVDALVSNIGHCLWTGILEPARAAIVAERLMSPEMFSGWGVRTLSSDATSYHPLSYHSGSVWPHDNALIAAGLMRYGHVDAAHRIMLAQIDASVSFEFRMPEFFSGIDREFHPIPVGVPNACMPQAWAAATPLMFLRTMLRLEPWMPQEKLWLAPALPDRIRRLRVENIPLLGGRITVDVEGDDVAIEGLPKNISLVDEPRAPLTAPRS